MDILPAKEDPRDLYERMLWEREECYRFYVEQRRTNCTFMELMDLWLEAPYCSSCGRSDPFLRDRPADIWARHWPEDLPKHLEVETVRVVRVAGGVVCHNCGGEVPWNSDDLFVFRYHLEEHYGIPVETPGKMWPPSHLRERIIELYDGCCFGCGANNHLHVDHVRPRSKGGDAAFRNLQPLCERCGQRKADADPEEMVAYSDLYFTPPPSDGYPGLFW